MNEILVKQGVKKELGIRLGVSQPTIRGALRGRTNSELARKIRFVAVKHFDGVELSKK